MTATKQPHLAMLWEAGDPQEALVRRFGFADAERAVGWLGEILMERWGIETISCERIMISAGNALAWLTTDTRRLLAKWSVVSRLHPRLAELARLTSWLGERGLPVSAPIPSMDGSLQVKVDAVSLGLQSVVDGAAHLDIGDPDQVHAAGAVLADLHLALADYPYVDRMTPPDGWRAPEPLADRLTRDVESMSADAVPARAAIEPLRGFLASRRSDEPSPTQLIHNDFRSANVLCTGATVTAVLDFEEVTFDHRIVDLAHAAVLLGTEFRNWGPVSPETQETFVAGYQSVRPLSEDEDAWLRALILWRTLRFVPAGDDPAGWGMSVPHLVRRLAVSRPPSS
jgi:homoserine kinase type II